MNKYEIRALGPDKEVIGITVLECLDITVAYNKAKILFPNAYNIKIGRI